MLPTAARGMQGGWQLPRLPVPTLQGGGMLRSQRHRGECLGQAPHSCCHGVKGTVVPQPAGRGARAQPGGRNHCKTCLPSLYVCSVKPEGSDNKIELKYRKMRRVSHSAPALLCPAAAAALCSGSCLFYTKFVLLGGILSSFSAHSSGRQWAGSHGKETAGCTWPGDCYQDRDIGISFLA